MRTPPPARPRDRAARVVLAAALGVSLLAACGTTAPLVEQRQVALRTADGLGSDLGTGAAPGVPGAAGSGRTGSAPGAVPGSGGGSGGVTAPGSTGGPAVGSTGGTTGTSGGTVVRGTGPVKVGFFVAKDVGEAAAAIGYDGLSTGDGATHVRASVALVNARGGIAGRKVVPVVFEYDATQEANNQFQAACSRFFDDEDVVAVVSVLLLTAIRQCSAKAGVPFVSSGNRTTNAADLAKNPLTALPPQLSLERFVPTWLTSLKAQGWFGTAPKIGLLFNEDPDYAAVPSQVERQLRALGLALEDKQSMPGSDDTSRVGAATSAGQSASLRFASRGITHVLTVDKSGQALAYFSIAAQNQGYYPLLGVSSLNLPNLLRAVLSARQLQGAKGIGWSPGVDLPVRTQPVVSSNASACLKAMSDAREDMSAPGARFSALATCEGLLLLAATWAGGDVSPAGFTRGLRGLGTRFLPALTFATDFSRRPDGASRYRPVAFDPACDCFAYTGPAQSAP